MNVYLIEDDGGVTVFDAGISRDDRGGAPPRPPASAASSGSCSGTPTPTTAAPPPGLDAAVYCHPAEREAAESRRAYRDYWDLRQARPARPRGPVARADSAPGTAAPVDDRGDRRARATRSPASGSSTCPGHAPGLIGLFREADRLALVSDCLYTLDPQTGRHQRRPRPASGVQPGHRAGPGLDPQARRARPASGRGPGHAKPVTGDVAAARACRIGAAECRSAVRRQQRKKLAAPDRASTADAEGNVLVLRGSLTRRAREYADVLAGGLDREDAWQRATELLFERLAVSAGRSPGARARTPEGAARPLPDGHRARSAGSCARRCASTSRSTSRSWRRP